MRSTTLGAALGADRNGLDRRAPGGQFVDCRDVEVGVGRHREGARNRGGGHHQLMRRLKRRGITGDRLRGPALVAQRQALVHAEAVLLVDHHQAQSRKSHAAPAARHGCRSPCRHRPRCAPAPTRARLPLTLPANHTTSMPSGSSQAWKA
jgi:hypothetical protein